MKKVLVLVLLFVGLTTFAQGKSEKMEPEEKVEKVLEHMKKELNLTDKQSAEIKTLLEKGAKEREEKRTQLKERKESGDKLSKDEKDSLKKEMATKRESIKIEMKKILTEEQFKKWESKFEDRVEKMKDRKVEKKELNDKKEKSDK